MPIENNKLHNESAFKKRIAHLLYPVIFSLFSILNANGQEIKDTTTTPNQKTTPPTEINKDKKTTENIISAPENAMDSVSAVWFQATLNKMVQPGFSPLEREKLIKGIIQRLAMYFNESDDPLKSTPKEDMYIIRNGMTQPLAWFLSNFWNEEYRKAGKLSVDVLSIHKDKGKIYIDLEYVFTKDLDKKKEGDK